MPKQLTQEEEILEAVEDVKHALLANLKAKNELTEAELRFKVTHSQIVKANERLRALSIEL